MADPNRPNPLSKATKKPASYVGDLDDLIGQTTDEGPGPDEAKRIASNEDVKPAEDVPRSRINLLLPTDLHKRFKGVTAMQGVTMTSVLEAFIREYVEGAMKDIG